MRDLSERKVKDIPSKRSLERLDLERGVIEGPRPLRSVPKPLPGKIVPKPESKPLNRVTLRIMKVFFEEILSGKKKVEYRDYKAFYQRLFEGKKVDVLKIHYQKSATLEVEVKKVRLIARPSFLTESDFSEKVYAIELGKILSVTK